MFEDTFSVGAAHILSDIIIIIAVALVYTFRVFLSAEWWAVISVTVTVIIIIIIIVSLLLWQRVLLLVELLQPSLISAHLIRMLTRWADMHWQVYVVRTSALYILKQLLSFEASPNENNLQHHFDHFNTDYTAFGNNVLITCIPPLAKQGGERWSTAELKYSTFTHRVSGYMAFFCFDPTENTI